MSPQHDQREEAARDIGAAKAELRGRRDGAVAEYTTEYNRRLQQLESIEAALESGDLTPRVAQDRVRQIMGERGAAGRPTHAGRTSIGLRLPASAQGAGPISIRSGPSPNMAGAALSKVQAEADTRIVALIMRNAEEHSSSEARLELSLLRQVRNSLGHQIDDMPRDSVLIDSIVEYADEAQAILNDLIGGGAGRLKRLLEYDRQLLSQLVALGGTAAGLKDQIRRAQEIVGAADPNLTKALQDAIAAFDHLQRELDQRLAGSSKTLFDAILRQ